ncbi:pyridoxal phosphate-dependent transferase [Amylocarpus encephaloides]|uniref:Pyridoxal phosphate-dependent transferase n=1 Tax=Amylocarpus encephaloides TaxID=45428 RepID=A0A9P8C929_9HELO|nr:pyridoxal phosphate-dependent transferase [Amylocarpus encephaloides]
MATFEYISAREATPSSTLPNPPLDFSYHFSRVTKQRQESSVKKLYKYFQIPGIGNLAGGLPNASFFPYDTLEAQIAQPQRFIPTPNDPNGPSDLSTRVRELVLGKQEESDVKEPAHLTVPHSSAVTNPLQKIDLTTALQYGTAQGYPPLYSYLRQFTRENLHPNVPYAGGPDIVLTNGSTDGFAKTLEALSNIWSDERDWIGEREGLLCEEFAYMNAIQTARPRGLNVVPVKIDLDGMVTGGEGGLEDVLENWDERTGKRPHLMYTVTMGQNPTSSLLPVQRRKDIYAICSKYDVLIIEDDPYWYLQFPSAVSKEALSRGLPTPPQAESHKFDKTTGYPFLDSLVPSSLNLDPDGRVIRLDTFSKTVAPGCRLGWITAQPAIIERILRITESSTQQPSGFVQSMIAELLMGPQPAAAEFGKKNRADQLSFTGWQTDGWIRWLEGLRGGYERRMTRMCDILEAGRYQLKQGTPSKTSESEWAVISKTRLYSFDWPRAGMFLWVQVHFESHPLFSKVGGPKLATALWVKFTEKPFLVLVAPGTMFSPTTEVLAAEGWKYYRLCFAAVDEEDIERCSEGFAEGVKAFWAIKKEEDLPELGDDAMDQRGNTNVLDVGMPLGC